MLKIPTCLTVMENINGYSESADNVKLRFHREGANFLRSLAKELGMPSGTYTIRSNKAGPAVSGEVTLHGETLYVQLSESCIGRGVGILYRSCRGMHDYSGGRNNWTMLKQLNAPAFRESFIEHCKLLGGFQ